MDFEIFEHSEAKTRRTRVTKEGKQSLFAEQFEKHGGDGIFQLEGVETKPVTKDDIEQEDPIELKDFEAASEFEALLGYSQSQSSVARSHAFKALEMGLMSSKRSNDTDSLRLYYSPEYTPMTHALTAIEHDEKSSLQPLLLISQLIQAEECYIYELMAPFCCPDACRLGIFHCNASHTVKALYDLIDAFSEEQRDVSFLILERLAPNDEQIVRLFEKEIAVQFVEMQRRGAFLTTSGRVSLRNFNVRSLDFGVAPLLMANFDFSMQGAEILQVLVLILQHALKDEETDVIELYRRFVADELLENEAQLRDCQELLCELAYMLQAKVAIQAEFAAKMASEYAKTLVNFPFTAWNIKSEIGADSFANAIHEAANQFNNIPVNLMPINKFLETQAPQIQFNDAGLRKIRFAHLFKKELQSELCDETLPCSFRYLLARGPTTVAELSAEMAFEFDASSDVLDGWDQIGYIGIFMLACNADQAQLQRAILPKLKPSAQDIAFLFAYFLTCEEERKFVSPGIFDILNQTKLSLLRHVEVRVSAKVWERFYSFFLESCSRLLRVEAFLTEEDARSIVRFADIDNSEVSAAVTGLKRFYTLREEHL